MSRGGAGNILAREQENARISKDLEANQQAAEAALTDHGNASREQQRYAHSGRGGAGNYYSPQELSQTGHFSDAHRSHIVGDGTLPPADRTSSTATGGAAPPSYNSVQAGSGPSRTVGRGGAGNWMFGVSEDEATAARKRMEEEKKREQLKADVEKGVKEALAEPPKAKLPGGEPF